MSAPAVATVAALCENTREVVLEHPPSPGNAERVIVDALRETKSVIHTSGSMTLRYGDLLIGPINHMIVALDLLSYIRAQQTREQVRVLPGVELLKAVAQQNGR